MKKIVIKVNINCQICKTEVLKAVTKLTGIDKVSVDGEKGMLTIVGEVDPVLVVRNLKKIGKVPEIISVGPPKPPEYCEEFKFRECRPCPPSSFNWSFFIIGQQWVYLDNFRGTSRWHICFNFVVLRMISFGYDYHWADQDSRFDQEKHVQRCHICKSGKTCYQLLQERSVPDDKYSLSIYICYLVYAPLYLAGPIISFNAFASQLDVPQNNYSVRDVTWYGLRWVFSLLLIELMTHLFQYNAFAISGLWKQLSPMDVFIIGYGVLNFMWLKFFLIWRYFRFWSLICGIEAPENMPRCINNSHNLEGFWKNWHASYNKWLVRYMYIPLGGSQKKLLNVWVIFTFVAIWHDLEWKLLSWAWLTCLFFIPEMILKSTASALQVESALGQFVFRELSAVAGAVTITCLMIANLVGYVIGPSGINWLVSQFLQKEGLPVLGGMFVTFYVGTKLMFHIDDAKQRKYRSGL
ncbi:hypothetical protein ACJW30_03G001300 [Castanea mollissima]